MWCDTRSVLHTANAILRNALPRLHDPNALLYATTTEWRSLNHGSTAYTRHRYVHSMLPPGSAL